MRQVIVTIDKTYLILRCAPPFETPPAAAPPDKARHEGRSAAHAALGLSPDDKFRSIHVSDLTRLQDADTRHEAGMTIPSEPSPL
jgi:hypothetical protein